MVGDARAIGHLATEGGKVLSFPSEPEWGKRPRHRSVHLPWGNESDPDRSNYEDTGIRSISTVGCFPGGASPYGVEDLSGNVWEWTRSRSGNYPYPTDWQEQTWRENVQAVGSRRVLRGGAYDTALRLVRCAYRNMGSPNSRDYSIGFRVVLRPAS